jgi:signal transduction histidine kinase
MIDKSILWHLISNENKIHLYRILQECIQNINKYAQASNCFVFIFVTNSIMTLKIWDDGIGFDSTNVKKGIGLRNIKERTISLNGNIEIISKKGTGTEVIVTFEMLKEEKRQEQFMQFEALNASDYDL